MTIEEMIQILETEVQIRVRTVAAQVPDNICAMEVQALKEAAQLLKERLAVIPLGAAELKRMEGETVWACYVGEDPENGEYAVVHRDYVHGGRHTYHVCSCDFDWIAYRQKPGEGAV